MDDQRARARMRAKLILGAERAFGATGIQTPAEPIAVAQPSQSFVPAAPNAQEALHKVESESGSPIAPSKADAPALFAEAKDQPAPLSTFGPNRPPFSEVPHTPARKLELLREMDEREVKGCPKCELCKTRTHTVFGDGDGNARLMFIGEGPGENEDLQGKPFVGRAGELLNKMIVAMGLSREKVYIANIVKCRPPSNRVPAPEEVSACTPYLERQIEIIRPQVIVTLGLPSTQYMLQSKSSMSRLRGLWHSWRGIKLMPTYHPAYVLRSYTEQTRKAVWSDLQQVMVELSLPIPKR